MRCWGTDAVKQFDLTGRVALVTGATRGIGLAIADGLERAGATVIAHGRNATAPIGCHHRYVGADLSHEDGALNLSAALADADRLDILVNNAGYEIAEDSASLSTVEWQTTMNVNLLAPTRLVGQLLPQLKASTAASVINITSIHERIPYPGHLAYSVSKAGLSMATRALAIELGPVGIRVNAIAPGIIETDINRHTIEAVGRQNLMSTVPLRRLGTPEDIVGPAVFLASTESSYVTGSTLFVDGAYNLNLVRYADQ